MEESNEQQGCGSTAIFLLENVLRKYMENMSQSQRIARRSDSDTSTSIIRIPFITIPLVVFVLRSGRIRIFVRAMRMSPLVQDRRLSF